MEECQRLGPLLGGVSHGDKEEQKCAQLSQIVRAIASGKVHAHLQGRINIQEVRDVPASCFSMYLDLNLLSPTLLGAMHGGIAELHPQLRVDQKV